MLFKIEFWSTIFFSSVILIQICAKSFLQSQQICLYKKYYIYEFQSLFSEPYLYPPEVDLFYKYLNNAKVYFEFGSGGTTQQAIKRKLKIYVAETHQSWIDQMKSDVEEIKNKITKMSNESFSFPIDINYILADIDSGPQMSYTNAQKYVRLYNHSKYKADFICVNGKLKFAVTMNLYNQVDENTIIFVNELENSSHISNITKYFDVLDTQWKSLVIRKKQNQAKMTEEELILYEKEDIFSQGKTRRILDKLRYNLNNIIDKYRFTNDSLAVQTPVYKIWVMWWDGEQKMTNISKICLEAIKRNFKKGTITLITSKNYYKYVNIPKHIMDLLKSKKISIVNFSDILRVLLIRTQGGLWLDSTMFTTKEIPTDIFDYSFYTIRGRIGFIFHHGKWNMFLIASKINSSVTMFVADAFDAYFKKFEHNIDHFMIDYLFLFGYEYIPIVRKLLQKIPPNNEYTHRFIGYLKRAYNVKSLEKIKRSGTFYKLNNKIRLYLVDKNNKSTIYSYLLKEYL